MASSYVRSTRPIGSRQEIPKKEPPNIDTTPLLTRLIFCSLENALNKKLEESFHKIQLFNKLNRKRRSVRRLAATKLLGIFPRVRERMMYQSLFLIRNFVPAEVKANFDEINWHRDGNERELVDPKSEILRGIMFMPFKRMRRDNKDTLRRREVVLPEMCLHSLESVLHCILLKSKLRAMESIKSHGLLDRRMFQSAIIKLKALEDRRCLLGFSKIKYCLNRLYLKPRTEEVHKYRSLAVMKSEMNIEAERREIIKQGIDRERSYRNEIIIARERELRSQAIEVEDYYQMESDRLRTLINQQEVYIQNVFSADLNDTSVEQFDYFGLLRSIYLDLTENDRTTVLKRTLVKKYQLEEPDLSSELAIEENTRLWEQVKAYEAALGRVEPCDFKAEEGLRAKQRSLAEENGNMKRVIGFYVKEEYGRNLSKENRLVDNLKKQLEEVETKLEENRIEEVKMMLND